MPAWTNMRGALHKLGRVLPPRLRSGLALVARPDRFVRMPAKPTYQADGLVTSNNSDFQRDPKFARAYQLGRQTGSWQDSELPWRVYVACWAADQVKGYPGDFVECGVNRGGLARAVCDYVDLAKSSRRFWLLDTFRGLVESQVSAEERAHGVTQSVNGYEECYEDVVATFAAFPNVEIVRGPVPDTLPQVTSDKICYLSIDMNCVAPEIAAAEYFWPKLVPGGVVVLDDYGFTAHIQQKHAFDEFAKAKGVRVLSLPTGQGLMFKPAHPSAS